MEVCEFITLDLLKNQQIFFIQGYTRRKDVLRNFEKGGKVYKAMKFNLHGFDEDIKSRNGWVSTYRKGSIMIPVLIMSQPVCGENLSILVHEITHVVQDLREKFLVDMEREFEARLTQILFEKILELAGYGSNVEESLNESEVHPMITRHLAKEESVDLNNFSPELKLKDFPPETMFGQVMTLMNQNKNTNMENTTGPCKAQDNVLLVDMESTFSACLATAVRKNHDYGGSNNDPYANFRNSMIAGVPVDRGILVRLMDKMSRISTLLDKEAQVKDEAIDDTIDDAINYLAILKSYRKNNK